MSMDSLSLSAEIKIYALYRCWSMCTMSDLSQPLQKAQGIVAFIVWETWIQELALGLKYAWNIKAKIQATGGMMSILPQIAPCGLPIKFSEVSY